MVRPWWMGVGVLVLLAAGPAWGQRMRPMEPAPDPTPLLWDRLRTFDVVLVGTLPEGFEGKVQAERGTNTVRLTVQVGQVLKGTVEGKDYQINIHQDGPKILAKRDAGTKREYLLALAPVSKGVGHLGTGSVYDVERFYLNDAGLERVVAAFLAAKDDTPAGMLKLCDTLLLAKDALPLGAGLVHVQELLAQAVRQVDGKDWLGWGQEKMATLAGMAQRDVTAGENVGGWAQVLRAMSQRPDVPAGVTVLPDGLKAPLRKWLDGEVARVADYGPTESEQQRVRAVVSLLGDLKDQEAKDVLLKVGTSAKWARVRREVLNTLVLIFGPDGQDMLPGGGGRMRPGR